MFSIAHYNMIFIIRVILSMVIAITLIIHISSIIIVSITTTIAIIHINSTITINIDCHFHHLMFVGFIRNDCCL